VTGGVPIRVQAAAKRYGSIAALRGVSLDVPALVLMVPGAVLLLLLERFLKSEYLVFFGQL
jgi:hypothetical protein